MLVACRFGDVTDWYSLEVPRSEVVLSYHEAMAACLLLAEAADASLEVTELRDTWAEEDGCDHNNRN